VVITGSAVTTILSCFVVFPVTFVALIVKLNVPAVVGVPVINPVPAFKLKPAGKVPLATAQVIGDEPLAASL
jgi:hypothetical protein